MIFDQIRGKPWYGKNAGLLQGLTTSPYHIKLTGGYFLSVPGPIVAQCRARAVLHLVEKPQCARRGHDETERVGAEDALPLTALILPQTSEGVGVAYGNFHGPAVAILAHDFLRAQRQVGGEKGFDDWKWFSLAWPFSGRGALTAQHYHPHQTPRQHRVPQAIPGVDLRPCFTGMGRPPLRGLGQGLG